MVIQMAYNPDRLPDRDARCILHALIKMTEIR
jgi:hypothetical protein